MIQEILSIIDKNDKNNYNEKNKVLNTLLKSKLKLSRMAFWRSKKDEEGLILGTPLYMDPNLL